MSVKNSLIHRIIDETFRYVHSLWMTEKFYRPDWDTYFMNIADVVATRGNCLRRQVAAVIVKDHRIVSTGYNGTPSGVTNCCDGGCSRCAGDSPSGADLGDCVCLHAEENAVAQATSHEISLQDTVIYSTLSPCLTCAKMIINVGIKEVVYRDGYEFDEQAGDLFSRAGVNCRRIS